MEQINTGRLTFTSDAEKERYILRNSLDGSVVGWVRLQQDELFVWIDNEHRRLGYGTEAAKAAVWHALQNMNLDMLKVHIAKGDVPGQGLLEKLGFVEYAGEWRFYHTDYLPSPVWELHAIANLEEMGSFFDARAEIYDKHMFSFGGGASYEKLGAFIPQTPSAIRILDIGCGTGIELPYIWRKAPNAHITCVDLSRKMLELLVKNHKEKLGQIEVIEASYVNWNYPKKAFDLVVSSNTMHHFWEAEKVAIYRKICSCLVRGGSYIENDFIVDEWCEKQYRRRYERIVQIIGRATQAGEYHIDIPFTIKRQTQLLNEAGFLSVDVLDDSVKPRWSGAILRASK